MPTQSMPQSQFNYPPPKSMRISDMYFPDPMFYPGFYPSGQMNPYDPYNNRQQPDYRQDMSQMFDKMARVDKSKNFMHNDFDKYERSRVNQVPRDKPRYNALSDFVNTVHNIHNTSKRGNNGMSNRLSSYSSGGGGGNSGKQVYNNYYNM